MDLNHKTYIKNVEWETILIYDLIGRGMFNFRIQTNFHVGKFDVVNYIVIAIITGVIPINILVLILAIIQIVIIVKKFYRKMKIFISLKKRLQEVNYINSLC
jgi:hypothetical protein